MHITVTIPITIMDQSFAADVDVLITTRSESEIPRTQYNAGCPAEICEWEVQEVRIRHGSPISGAKFPYLPTRTWLTDMIADSDELADAVAAAEREEPRGRAARDPDMMREDER